MSFYERTYGEINDLSYLYNEIKNIFSFNNINHQDYIFYDFGSGYGKIVNFFSKYYKKSIGIEIDKERFQKSLNYDNNNIEFYNSNFFDTNIDSSCIILINNLCLGTGTNKRLSYKLLHLWTFKMQILTNNNINNNSKIYNQFNHIYENHKQ